VHGPGAPPGRRRSKRSAWPKPCARAALPASKRPWLETRSRSSTRVGPGPPSAIPGTRSCSWRRSHRQVPARRAPRAGGGRGARCIDAETALPRCHLGGKDANYSLVRASNPARA
jgi:hypothetical protein